MLNKIFFIIIKFLVWLVKKTKLDITAFDKIIFCLGDIKIGQNKNLYNSVEDLSEVEVKIFSQNGEDGIIDFIITRLKLKSRNFVEVGVGDYRESNTRYIYNKYHPKGLIIDCINNMEHKVKPFVNLWKGDLRIVNKQIDSENINLILSKNCNFEIDVFSLDIDGLDYWVIQELKPKISKVFILEYNAVFGPYHEVTVPNIKNFDRTKAHYSNLYFGASLMAYINLLKEKGFYFLGVNRLRNNAFFINEDFSKEKYFKNLSILSLNECTNANFSESRDKNGNLNFLRKEQKIELIKNCEVVNLKDKKNKLVKIKDLN